MGYTFVFFPIFGLENKLLKNEKKILRWSEAEIFFGSITIGYSSLSFNTVASFDRRKTVGIYR